jgi:putative transposase
MIRGFKFRFYPTPAQEVLLAKTFGCSRFVYNELLKLRQDAWTIEKRKIGFTACHRELSAMKRRHPWLCEVSSRPLQQEVAHLQRAYVNWWEGRAKSPVFKKKTSRQSVAFTRWGFSYRHGTLIVAKIGQLEVAWSQPFTGQPSMVYLSRTPAGRYYVSLQIDEPLELMPAATGQIGIDLGLTCYAALDDGRKEPASKPLQRSLRRLRSAQRRLSRRQPGSRNRVKARLAVATIHQRVADIRANFLHQLSTRLVRENQTVVAETLNVAGMLHNRRLARHIADAAWGEFLRQLEYKCAWHGRTFVKVDRFFPSSKTCSACGHQLQGLPLSVRAWTCPRCGAYHDRDINAAKNTLAEGLAVIACGEDIRRRRESTQSSAKQEPSKERRRASF